MKEINLMQSLDVLVQGILKAQKSGVFDLNESYVLKLAIDKINESIEEQKKEKETQTESQQN